MPEPMDLLRARFPESAGWPRHSIDRRRTGPFESVWHAEVDRSASPFYEADNSGCDAWGKGETEAEAVNRAIAAWDAALEADPKVKRLVEAARAIKTKLHWSLDPNARDEPNAAEDEIDTLIAALAAFDGEGTTDGK